MPWHQEPMKDVISCEKLWGGANIHRFIDIRMRKLIWREMVRYPYMSKVVYVRGTWGTETSQYPQEKKENSIPRVVASEIGRAQTRRRNFSGVKDYIIDSTSLVELCGKANHRRWESSIRKASWHDSIQSSARHVKSRMNTRGPPRKAKYYLMTDSVEVPWGKVEKNPGRGVK